VITTSVGGTHTITVPEGVRVTSLSVDDDDQPVDGNGGALSVALEPGRQRVSLAWKQPGTIGMFYRAPEVRVGDQLTNANVLIDVPPERLRLLVGGPRWGPDIAIWGYLALLLLLGLALGRLPQSPLKSWQWALLAAGLTQPPLAVVLLIALWFFAVKKRKGWSLRGKRHNIGQVAFGLLTMAFAMAIALTAYHGVAEKPDLLIAQDGSWYDPLSWYADRTDGAMPRPWVISASPWIWRLLMAAWSAWIVMLLVPWAKEAWQNFNDGGLWIQRARAPDAPAAVAEAAAVADPAAVADAVADAGPAPDPDPDADPDPPSKSPEV
jgi:hypothetical protein